MMGSQQGSTKVIVFIANVNADLNLIYKIGLRQAPSSTPTRLINKTRVLWNTYPVRCCCMKLCEIQLIAEEDYKFTYFCTVDNGDCIVYNQASMNMDLLN